MSRVDDIAVPPGRRGMVYYVNGNAVDFDGDGDLDFLAGIWPKESSHLYRNDSRRKGRWLQVEVVGKKMNRMGIGAKIRVLDGRRLAGYAEISVNGGYSGSRPAIAHFGLGYVESVTVEARLPSRAEPLRFEGVAVDRTFRIVEPE
jgi:hypothetical protein